MYKIQIISTSIRNKRNSHRVALFLESIGGSRANVHVSVIDLAELALPLSHERLRYLKDPPANIISFSERIAAADGVILVVPEYNGGYPASVKNAIDLLYDEWKWKPIAFSTVSTGAFGGSQVIMQLQFVLWKMKAWTIPASMPVPNVEKAFNEKGEAMEESEWHKRANALYDDLERCMRAYRGMIEKKP